MTMVSLETEKEQLQGSNGHAPLIERICSGCYPPGSKGRDKLVKSGNVVLYPVGDKLLPSDSICAGHELLAKVKFYVPRLLKDPDNISATLNRMGGRDPKSAGELASIALLTQTRRHLSRRVA